MIIVKPCYYFFRRFNLLYLHKNGRIIGSKFVWTYKLELLKCELLEYEIN